MKKKVLKEARYELRESNLKISEKNQSDKYDLSQLHPRTRIETSLPSEAMRGS